MPISRRQFCAAVGAAGIVTLTRSARAGESHGESLTVIAYNVLACTGYPPKRPRAKSAVATGKMAELLAQELARYKPDIVNFSESPREAIAKEVARRLDMNHVRFPSAGSWPGTILSRFEIVDSQNVPLGFERPKGLFTRHWGRATLKLSNGEPLIVHSAHLYPHADPATRLREIPAMLASMQKDLQAGRSMLLMGDLNLRPESEEYRLWIKAGWTDTFAKVGKGQGLTIVSDNPRARIDYIMAAGPIAERIVESRPLFEGAFRLDTADPEAFALSDHVPQLARFGGRK